MRGGGSQWQEPVEGRTGVSIPKVEKGRHKQALHRWGDLEDHAQELDHSGSDKAESFLASTAGAGVSLLDQESCMRKAEFELQLTPEGMQRAGVLIPSSMLDAS